MTRTFTCKKYFGSIKHVESGWSLFKATTTKKTGLCGPERVCVCVGAVPLTRLYLVNNLCATLTSLILTKPHPIFGNDAGNQPPAPDPSRLGGVLSAARFVVRTRPKPFVMGLPCVFVIGLLASAIRPRLPVIGADVRQIREPRSGKTANAFDAQGPVMARRWSLVKVAPGELLR